MKKFLSFSFAIAIAAITLASCNSDEKKPAPAPQAPPQPKKEVYQPKHQSQTVDLTTPKKYVYYKAPQNTAATSVDIKYDPATEYTPIEITYKYANGDTYTYNISADFGLWPNEAGKLRIMSDSENTVWLQGQTKNGAFHEFIFYGNPKFNDQRIKPNSYVDDIRYR